MEPPKNDPQRGGSIVICLSAEVKLNTGSVGVKASKSKPANAQKAVKKVETSAEEVYTDEVPRTFEDKSSASSTNALDALCCETKADVQADTKAKNREPCNRVSPSGDPRPFEPEGKTGINNGGTANDCEGAAWTTTKDGKNSKTPVLQECSAHENGADKGKDPVRYISGVEHVTESDEVVDGTSENLADRQSKEFGSAELRLTSRASDVVREKSEIELEYDMVDPLEGSLHVAIEVEKEAVDCREGSCSSDGSPESVSQRPDNTASETETRTCVQEELSKEVPSDEKLSTKNSELSRPASCVEKKADEFVNVTQDIEYSQVTSVSQEPADAGKNVWTFDLNEEVCMEMDGLEKQISTPIPVASASRATTAAGMQGALFHFEGNLGWRGSAATRGCRAASSCQVPEVDKGLSVGESSNSSKQRDDCLDIDLNNNDSLNEIMVDPLTGTHNRDPSGLPSGKSADAASQRKSERLFLDLNCVTDDVKETSDWQAEGQLHLTNDHRNRSPSSSSSSKQHSFKNFDLNDQPSFSTEFSGHPNFIKQHQSYNTSVAKKIDDSMISIMGMRVEVNKTTSNSFPFGRNPASQPPLDANLARATGLIGIGSAVPFSQSSSAMYGPGGRLPYMLESKVAPAPARYNKVISELKTNLDTVVNRVNSTASKTDSQLMAIQLSHELHSRKLDQVAVRLSTENANRHEMTTNLLKKDLSHETGKIQHKLKSVAVMVENNIAAHDLKLTAIQKTQDLLVAKTDAVFAATRTGEDERSRILKERAMTKADKKAAEDQQRIIDENSRASQILTNAQIQAFREEFTQATENAYEIKETRIQAFIRYLERHRIGSIVRESLLQRMRDEEFYGIPSTSSFPLSDIVDALFLNRAFQDGVTRAAAYYFWKWLYAKYFPTEKYNHTYLQKLHRGLR